MIRNLKKIFILLLVISLVVSIQGGFSVKAAATLAEWHLVDSGKHLDWDGNTNFMVQFKAAVNIWNEHKAGVIRKDNWKIVEDVSVSDYFTDDAMPFRVLSSGKIKFNQYYMDSYDNAKKTNACVKAIGRALGLAYTKNSQDVMFITPNYVKNLSDNDKDSYNKAYKEMY